MAMLAADYVGECFERCSEETTRKNRLRVGWKYTAYHKC